MFRGEKTYKRFILLNALVSALRGKPVPYRVMLDEMIRDYYRKILDEYGLTDEEAKEMAITFVKNSKERKFIPIRNDLEEIEIA